MLSSHRRPEIYFLTVVKNKGKSNRMWMNEICVWNINGMITVVEIRSDYTSTASASWANLRPIPFFRSLRPTATDGAITRPNYLHDLCGYGTCKFCSIPNQILLCWVQFTFVFKSAVTTVCELITVGRQ
jgi:hypothetical protein